jgi:hypothetical protein
MIGMHEKRQKIVQHRMRWTTMPEALVRRANDHFGF